jgi:eukaryotic-like serine/threonine-protein kinase
VTMATPVENTERTLVRRVGRYLVLQEIAAGGMASVHYGRLVGEGGFARTVAIKCMHAHLAKDQDFTAAFLDEARLAARIEHPNVVKTLDIVREASDLMIVMEYVIGESLSKLIATQRRTKTPFPLDVVSAMICDTLHGLHAAHTARDERNEPLNIVHRDVSPQNVLVGRDGITRVFDFGIAKASGRLQTTQEGQLKGKLAYMAPEQLLGRDIDARVDVYAVGIMLWELCTGRRLFAGDNEGATLTNALHLPAVPPSQFAPETPAALDEVVLRALQRDPSLRFQSALEMAEALEAAFPPAPRRRTSEFVETVAHENIQKRAQILATLEQTASEAFANLNASKPKRTMWIVAAITLSVLALGGFALWRLRANPSAATTPAVAATSSTVLTGTSTVTPSALLTIASADSAAAVLVRATATPARTQTAVSPRPTKAPSAITSKTAPPVAPTCKVTTFVDGDGITQFRKVCE